jgi:uncharacterized membrane protein
MVSTFKRLLQHATTGRYHVRALIPEAERARISSAITELEKRTCAELRLVVEASLDSFSLLRGYSARHRAEQVFSEERIWDTEHNNGVLLYLLVAERDAEIVADRGLNGKVSSTEWAQVCSGLESNVKDSGFVSALLVAIDAITVLLERAFPGDGGGAELSDEVVVR